MPLCRRHSWKRKRLLARGEPPRPDLAAHKAALVERLRQAARHDRAVPQIVASAAELELKPEGSWPPAFLLKPLAIEIQT